MSLKHFSQDAAANRGHLKSQVFCFLFRLSQSCRQRPQPLRLLLLPVIAFYKLVSELLFSIEIPAQAVVGPGLVIRHGFGIVVHKNAVLGAGVVLRQGVTIGAQAQGDQGAPVIGDRVEFGVNSVALGAISLGDDAKVGACALVLQDVPPAAVAVGVPAKIRKAPGA